MRWTLKLFGGVQLERDGTPVEGAAAQRQRLALLAVVASSPSGIARERALTLLWPETAPDRARHALANAVYALRKALPDGAFQSTTETLRVDPALLSVDVLAFTRAIEAGDLESAIALYSGPFLRGFTIGVPDFEHWVDGEQAQRAREYRGALGTLASDAAAREEHEAALDLWRRFAESDPLDTTGALALMQAHLNAGDPVSAVRHARVYEALLDKQLDLPVDSRVEALAEQAAALAAEVSQPDPSEGLPARSAPAIDGGALPAPEPVPEPALPTASFPSRRVVGALAGGALLVAAAILGLELTDTSTIDIDRIAVLPLDNLSTDPDQSHFADAMTEVLTAELARIDGIEVVSRTSAQRFRGSQLSLDAIATELGVDALIEGSVFRAGEDVLITAQLVAVDPERHVWADSYEGKVGEAIRLQRRVARSVAETVEQAIAPVPLVTRPDEAWDAYFLGISQQQRFTAEAVEEAVQSLERAVLIDPTFADAWSKLAESYWMLAQPLLGMPHGEGMARAREAAITAQRLAPTDPLASSVLGWVELFAEWRPREAEERFRRSIRLAPGRPSGHAGLSFALSAQGRHDEAAAAARQARDLEPLVLSFRTSYAEILLYGDRLADAHAEIERALAMDPLFSRARTVGRWIFEAEERWEEALSLATDEPLAGASVPRSRDGYWRWWLEQLDGRIDVEPMSRAWVWAELGEVEQAMPHLEAALETRDGSLALIDVAPQWDRIRDTPEFMAFRARVH